MNLAYKLNDAPPSALSNCKLPIRCTTKKVHKNNPVSAMISFLPKDELKVVVNQLILLFFKFYINTNPCNLVGQSK